MTRWPDAEVIWFSPPWPGARVWPSAEWIRIVIDADWLFRHGWDSMDIAEGMGVHEAVVCRALAQARSARRQPDGGASNATSFDCTAKTNEGGGSVA